MEDTLQGLVSLYMVIGAFMWGCHCERIARIEGINTRWDAWIIVVGATIMFMLLWPIALYNDLRKGKR